jgi:hypothetical protein
MPTNCSVEILAAMSEKPMSGPLLPALEHAHAHDDDKEQHEDRQVQPVHRHIGLRSQPGI